MLLLKKFNIISFLLINFYIFLWGFINPHSIYPFSEVIIMSVLFFLILIIQIIFSYLANKFGLILSLLFSSGNLIFFNLILNGYSNFFNFIFLLIFFLLILFLNFISLSKVFFYFAVLFFSTFIFKFSFDDIDNKVIKSEKKFTMIKKTNKSNIFFIGVDGMISNEMFFNYFKTQSSATKTLDSLDFVNFDFYSPGFSTLETYAKFLSYSKDIHVRESFKVINNENSFFYLDSKNLGYKKQFNFITNYFGGDPNNIFDSYYPRINKPFSFVIYTDNRWGWYSAYLIKKILFTNSDIYPNQFEMIYDRINSLDLNKGKWISISHLWYPGHTLNNYNMNNLEDFSYFSHYYKYSQRSLSVFFKEVSNIILSKDKNSVIVFYGDHGAFFLKGYNENSKLNDMNVTDSLVFKDNRQVLVAVYPNDFLNSEDIDDIKSNPEKLFQIVLNKQ